MCFVEAKAVIRMPRHRRSLANSGGPAVGELVPNIVRLVPLLRTADCLSASATNHTTAILIITYYAIYALRTRRLYMLSTRAAKRQGSPRRLTVSLPTSARPAIDPVARTIQSTRKRI